MSVTEQLKTLVDQMPNPDGSGMLTTDIDKETIDKTVAAIAKGGKDYLVGLVQMLGEPGSVGDAKPHYALHCVVNYVLITRNESLRKEFCDALAAQLQNKNLSSYNRSYLCQELQWAGRDEACPALGKVLLEDDVTDAATTALVAIGGERAAAQLRAAVPGATGKARLNLIDALVSLSDPKSADIFKQAMADQDREIRLAAAAGLGQLGQADSAHSLLQAADAAQGWERIQLTKSCLVLAERLAATGNKGAAKQIYVRLKTSRTGKSEQHIRDAAQLGLAAIG